jgi:hypothetical protein
VTHPRDPDPDDRITKMKDGRSHLVHKADRAVDLGSSSINTGVISAAAASSRAITRASLGHVISSTPATRHRRTGVKWTLAPHRGVGVATAGLNSW